MLAFDVAHASAQLTRNSAGEVLAAPDPLTEAALESFRRRNALLDAIFYDTRVVTADEGARLATWLAHEGAILLVPPTGAGPLRLFASVDEFVDMGGTQARALAIAGVGSSALGSAAFARNIADAFRAPVAAVVSGYGLADLMTEAMGGWFWFRTLNGMRHGMEKFDEITRPSHSDPTVTGLSTNDLRLSLDTKVVLELLSDPRLRFRLLTGHSKGNLVLAEALYKWLDAPAPRGAIDLDTQIVTVSAAIYMPDSFRNIVDVIGALDWFGAINSRPDVGIEVRVPMAWHHTSTAYPYHLPVTATFQNLIRDRGLSLR